MLLKSRMKRVNSLSIFLVSAIVVREPQNQLERRRFSRGEPTEINKDEYGYGPEQK